MVDSAVPEELADVTPKEQIEVSLHAIKTNCSTVETMMDRMDGPSSVYDGISERMLEHYLYQIQENVECFIEDFEQLIDSQGEVDKSQ